MATRAEQEIMKNWKFDGPPLVSVVCITYNHELFIREAIEGFLIQETDFPFEIIIHDDASTDHTPQIIREYASVFPNIIKPIFQLENQHSKGKKVAPLAWDTAKGTYVAFCEGDDYWINPHKLHFQLTAMLKNPNCDICVHSHFKIQGTNCKIPHERFADSIMPQVEVIPLKKIFSSTKHFQTASFFLRKPVLDHLPLWFFEFAPVGDFFYLLFGSLKGGALFLKTTMSVYRTSVSGSWSQQIQDKKRLLSHRERMDYCLKMFMVDCRDDIANEINALRSKLFFITGLRMVILKDYNYFLIYTNKSLSIKTRKTIFQRSVYFFKDYPSLVFWGLRAFIFIRSCFRSCRHFLLST
jgi:glycosyltransferase involved in cell wall biosynthesis